MLQVDNKFEVGQEVYIIEEEIKSIRNEVKCPICEGIGEIVHKGHKLRCPNCNNGITTVSIDRISVYSIIDRGKITSIRFQYANKNSFSVKYRIHGSFFRENRLASTEEEAIELCERLNNPEENIPTMPVADDFGEC